MRTSLDTAYTLIAGNMNTSYRFKAVSDSGLADISDTDYSVKIAGDTMKEVISAIDSLPDPGSASDKQITNSAETIKSTKILYDMLSVSEQSGIGQSRIDKLNKLISRLDALLVIIPKDVQTGIAAQNIGTSVLIPELNENGIGRVEVKLMVDQIASSGGTGSMAAASANLDKSATKLVAAYDISLFKSVFDSDGNRTQYGKIGNSSILHPLTIQIPVPEKYYGRTDLAVAYIDDSGNVTPLATTLVTIKGVQYLQFTTTHFSVYAVTVKSSETALIQNPETGGSGSNSALPLAMLGIGSAAGLVIIKRRKIYRRKTHS